MKTLLLGFDCRQPEAAHVQGAWDVARRRRYLLREDVTAVSVDIVATPSVFAFDPLNARRAPIHLNPADFHQQALGLWCRASEMEKTLRGRAPVGVMRMAVVLHKDNLEADQWWSDFAKEPVEPRELDEVWSPLGYDVADRHFTSALFNCGLDAGEKAQNAARWGPAINGHGLLPELHDAISYRDYASARLREHAPFFTFRIFQHLGPVAQAASEIDVDEVGRF